MSLLTDFHAVKTAKAAGVAGRPLAALCHVVWTRAKQAAARDPAGLYVGLTKLALTCWADTAGLGVKLARDQGGREAFVASFATAAVVDDAIDKLASQGGVAGEEAARLYLLNAEAAMHDLAELTKEAGVMDTLQGLPPEAKGALIGLPVGAGLGAWKDTDNRARGAVMGGLGGASVGALVGHGVRQHGEGVAKDVAANLLAAKDLAGRRREAEDLLDHMHDAADNLGHAGLSATIRNPASREDFVQHFLSGRQDLPPEIATHLTDQKAANTFHGFVKMKKGPGYRVGGGGPLGKKASLSSFAWAKLAAFDGTGGAPAMPTQAPQQVLPQAPEAAAPTQPAGPASPDIHPGDPNSPEQLGTSPEQAAAEAQQAQAEDMAKEMQQHATTVDNLAFLAQQVGLPSMAQEIQGSRDQLIQHFGAGNQHLPHNLQKYFPNSEHAKQFIEKYKARFAPLVGGGGKGGGGAKKTASTISYPTNDNPNARMGDALGKLLPTPKPSMGQNLVKGIQGFARSLTPPRRDEYGTKMALFGWGEAKDVPLKIHMMQVADDHPLWKEHRAEHGYFDHGGVRHVVFKESLAKSLKGASSDKAQRAITEAYTSHPIDKKFVQPS